MCVALGGGCELVLGALPPAKKHPDGGGGSAGDGTGGASTTSTTSTTGSTSTTGTGGATSAGGSGGTGGCCDCDGDHVLAKGLCGGTDCDDHDSRVHPGQTDYFGTPSSDPAVGFDLDCNGTPEQNPDLTKTVDCGVIGLPCAAGTGFLGKTPPPCGQGGPWGTCKQNGLGCVQAVIEQNKIMTCK